MKAVVWEPSSSVVDLAYVLDTEIGSDQHVAPDGRCGVCLVEGELWWFGPHTAPWPPPRPDVHVVGVRLSLRAGRRVAGTALRQWQNTRAPLDTVWEPAVVDRLATRAAQAASDVDRVRLLVEAVDLRIAAAAPGDDVTAALSDLVLTDTSVCEIAERVGLSPRQVHRRCLDEFGLPPSLLRRIARVHRAAAQRGAIGDWPALARLAADAGFADQAHLSREVRAMSGQSARALFG